MHITKLWFLEFPNFFHAFHPITHQKDKYFVRLGIVVNIYIYIFTEGINTLDVISPSGDLVVWTS